MRFDLTSKKIPLTALRNVIGKLFGQQPVTIKSLFELSDTLCFMPLDYFQAEDAGFGKSL